MSIFLIQPHADVGAGATSIALDSSLVSFPCTFDHDPRTPSGTMHALAQDPRETIRRRPRVGDDARGGA